MTRDADVSDRPDRPDRPGLVGAIAALAIIGAATAAVVLLVASVGPWAPDDPQASLAGKGSLMVAPPVPLAAGESYVRTELLSSGDLQVVQWIESDAPLFGAVLEPPPGMASDAGSAEQLRVVADGRIVEGQEQDIDGRAIRVSFPGVTSVQIRYRLSGALTRSDSAPGRALVRPTALDVTYEPASSRVTRTVVAPEVLSLACSPPAADTESPRPCGVGRSVDEWSVELEGPFAGDRVIASVSLK